jgi:hypothetical protein
MPGNHSEESIQHSEQGEILKSRKKLKFNIGKNNLQIQNKNLKARLMAHVVTDTQSA